MAWGALLKVKQVERYHTKVERLEIALLSGCTSEQSDTDIGVIVPSQNEIKH